MATATRVAQDSKRVETTRIDTVKQFVTTEVNGVERARDLITESIAIAPDYRYEPQPDRIRLDLSLEEAKYLKNSIPYMTKLGTGIWQTLRSALSPQAGTLGTTKETVQNPNAPGSCLKAPIDLSAGCKAASTISSGLAQSKAQAEARHQEKLAALRGYRW